MSNQVKKDGGEGDRRSARRYNEQAEKFAKSGKGKQAIDKAGNLSEEEAAKAKQAEREGEKRAREKDPEVTRDYDKPTK